MNRPGTVPQSLRGGIPGGFGQQQQQPQQSGRGVGNRLPNGKLASASSASQWAFGAGGPMGASSNGPPGSTRQLGGNISFAQSLSGSQPATPLDPSPFPQHLQPSMEQEDDEPPQKPTKLPMKPAAGFSWASVVKGDFPSLSSTSQISNPNPSSLWSGGNARINVPGPTHRGGGTPISSQTQQEDLFSSRLPSSQGTFRFGNQISSALSAQTPSNAVDDFPPLNRNANGDLSNLGYGSASTTQTNRAGNGLLNAISANTRATEARSPTTVQRPDLRSPTEENDARQKLTGYQDVKGDSVPQGLGNRNPLGAIGNDPPTGKAKEDESVHVGEVQDPLEGMAPIDKWGLKGLRTLMNNYPDYNALACGIDPSTLGLDVNSPELLSTQVYSLFDDTPPRPPVPKFRLPDCYQVKNVQPIEAKIQSFNEETLMWIFYSNPRDVKQQMAAVELTNRNWRWHKKAQLWLTKDDMMVPQALSPNHERGYYIIWDTQYWRKDRRELTLYYADLETNPGAPVQVVGA